VYIYEKHIEKVKNILKVKKRIYFYADYNNKKDYKFYFAFSDNNWSIYNPPDRENHCTGKYGFSYYSRGN